LFLPKTVRGKSVSRFDELFTAVKPVIGMIHLPPLPGYPDSPGLDGVIQHAVKDLHVLEQGGVDGVLVENEYDRPHRVKATAGVIEAMTEVTRVLIEESADVIVGCEILLNDPQASLDVAKMSGAKFIRTDYFVDAMTRPEYGEFEIDPDALMSYRASIEADNILIFADIQVKYARMIIERPLAESASLACEKGADAVVVTGDVSGDAPGVTQLNAAAAGTRDFDIPVLIGSGLDGANAAALIAQSHGAIVGTSLMRDRAVDAAAVTLLMKILGRES
jgi:membrane complex biogenesis BtpA family protein